MRKILLATAFAALAATAAQAQMPNQPLVSDSFGLNGNGGDYPAPGTVTVRFRARVLTEYGYFTDSGQVGKGTNGKPNGSKDAGAYLGTEVRMYPGVDGTLANGLKYGGAIEMRVTGGGTGGSTTNTPYIRRASLYVASPTYGRFIAGQADGALTQLYNISPIEYFDWIGSGNASPQIANSTTIPTWPFWENGGAYINNKIVYLSPSFAGFDGGVSFEPTQTTNDTNCGQAAATGCPTQTSVPNNSINVRRNTVELAARYKGSFGPVATNIQLGYVTSGKVQSSIATAVAGVAPATVKPLSVFDAGVTLSMAGFTVGGHYIGGAMNPAYNGGYGMKFSGQKDVQAFLVGARYAWSTFSVGANFQNQWSGGLYNAASPSNNNLLHETSIGTGGAWDWAPGATAFVSAVYATRHQVGVDLLNATPGAFNNSTQARWIVLGNVFRW